VSKRTLLLGVCVALWACNAAAQEPARVMPVYLVPRDMTFPPAGVTYHVRVLEDVRRWYGTVLGGRTFVAEPLIVQVSRHTFAQLAADSFQAWWPLLQQEFADYGWSWNHKAKFKLLFLTHGAGAWAGSDSENGGIDSTADAGKVDKGNWGGLAVIGDSSVSGVQAGVCPEVAHGKADSTVATAWWCSGSTYRGTVAHELGHTFGLPHPDAFRKGFRCADSTAYTIMQCHWGWGRAGLLDYEITHLRSLDFFRFDTTPAYVLLPQVRPLVARRAQSRALESGAPITWVDGRGGGSGYLWAVVLAGAGAEIRYALREGDRAQVVAFDLGIERGSREDAVLRVEADGRPRGQFTVAAGRPPQRIVLAVGGARRLRLAVVRGRGRVVLGNPRVYPER
jgi:hypothetical protein